MLSLYKLSFSDHLVRTSSSSSVYYLLVGFLYQSQMQTRHSQEKTELDCLFQTFECYVYRKYETLLERSSL